MRRREQAIPRYLLQDGTEVRNEVVEALKNSTFGGDKYAGKHAKRPARKLPKLANKEGIKVEWGPGEDEYPVFISVQMIDDTWVKYQIHREQPAFSPALEAVANMKRGYPPKRP